MERLNTCEACWKRDIDEKGRDYLAKKTGLVETVIGRMVPAPTAEMRAADVSWIKVEPYKELPVKRSGFVGTIPEIVTMTPHDNFDVFGARKLYVHNCGHALMAYMGYQRGYEYGYQALADNGSGSSCWRDCVKALMEFARNMVRIAIGCMPMLTIFWAVRQSESWRHGIPPWARSSVASW